MFIFFIGSRLGIIISVMLIKKSMYALRFKSNQKVFRFVEFKGAMVGLRHFRTTESLLKIMKKVF